MTAVSVREVGPDDWRTWRELRLRSLREDPAAFGSSLADWSGPRDTEERWRARLGSPGACFVARADGEPAGLVAADVEPDGSIQLVSMWVAPWARGRRVGEQLVDAVLDWAAGRPTWLRVVGTNTGAVRLYERCGFVLDGAVEVGDGYCRMHARRAVGSAP